MALLALPRADSAEREFTNFCLESRVRTIALIALVTRDVHAAEDAAQEAYARAYQRWKRVGRLRRPDLWVVRVGTNIAISNWKKTNREREIDLTNEQWSSETGDDNLEGLIARELWVRWGLGSLSVNQRVAFVMRHAQGWSTDEIAEAMGTTGATVRTHLDRARRRLQTLLGKDVKP